MSKLIREEQSLGAAMGELSSAVPADVDIRRKSFNAGDARYRETAGTFQNGDQVEYRAEMGSDWLPATVIGVSSDGWIRIDLVPDLWLHQEDQATKVRPGKPRPSSAGNPTPKAGTIMSTPLNDNVGFLMEVDSPNCTVSGPSHSSFPSCKRGPSPSSFQGVESMSQKRRAARVSPGASPGPPLRQEMGPGYSPNPVRKSKDDFHSIDGIKRRSSLEPPKPTSMSRSPSCPGHVSSTRLAGRHIMGA